MTLKLHDTLARKKRDFEPADPERVTLYVCGPTVYNNAHIGNARPPVVFDTLFRLLRRIYGADAETGIAEFEAALRLGAAPMAGVQYAALLLALDADAYRDRAEAALDWTRTQAAETAFDRSALERADALRNVMENAEARNALIHGWLGEP